MLEVVKLQEVPNALHLSRLDCVRMLCRQGFEMSHDCGRALFPDTELKFPQESVLRSSKLYWACLLLRSEIFERGAPCIYHTAPTTYYKALLSLRNLEVLHPIEEDVSTGGALSVQPLQALMDIDGNCDPLLEPGPTGEDDGEDLPPDPNDCGDCDDDGDGDGSMPALGQLILPISDSHAALRSSLASHYDRLSSTYVHFDNCSHSSGLMRGFVRCQNSSHKNCWKYTQISTRGSRKQTVAVLTAWAVWGLSVTDKADHTGEEPPQHMIDEVLARLSDIQD